MMATGGQAQSVSRSKATANMRRSPICTIMLARLGHQRCIAVTCRAVARDAEVGGASVSWKA